MINFDNYVGENKIEHKKNWPYTPDHPYGILTLIWVSFLGVCFEVKGGG